MKVTRITEHIEKYQLSFFDSYGSGWSIDCEAGGEIVGNPEWQMPFRTLSYAIGGYCDGKYEMSIDDYSRDLKHYEGTCDCGESLISYGGYDEFSCDKCGAEYNLSGQRLRANWRNNLSNYDSEMDDMEGYERGELVSEYEDY